MVSSCKNSVQMPRPPTQANSQKKGDGVEVSCSLCKVQAEEFGRKPLCCYSSNLWLGYEGIDMDSRMKHSNRYRDAWQQQWWVAMGANTCWLVVGCRCCGGGGGRWWAVGVGGGNYRREQHLGGIRIQLVAWLTAPACLATGSPCPWVAHK